jgi:Protein of unknown function (DUF2946)
MGPYCHRSEVALPFGAAASVPNRTQAERRRYRRYHPRVNRKQQNRRLTASVAMFAILWLSLAPTLSQALQGQVNRGWIEICTALGAKWVKIADDAQPSPPASQPAAAFDHCPYCSLQGHLTGMPAAPPAFVMQAPGQALPRVFLPAPPIPRAWQTAQPRAPPSAA